MDRRPWPVQARRPDAATGPDSPGSGRPRRVSGGSPVSEEERDAPTPEVSAVATDQTLAHLWSDPPGLLGKLKAVQNDAIGKRLILTGFFFLILGGSFDSVVMRTQL